MIIKQRLARRSQFREAHPFVGKKLYSFNLPFAANNQLGHYIHTLIGNARRVFSSLLRIASLTTHVTTVVTECCLLGHDTHVIEHLPGHNMYATLVFATEQLVGHDVYTTMGWACVFYAILELRVVPYFCLHHFQTVGVRCCSRARRTTASPQRPPPSSD